MVRNELGSQIHAANPSRAHGFATPEDGVRKRLPAGEGRFLATKNLASVLASGLNAARRLALVCIRPSLLPRNAYQILPCCARASIVAASQSGSFVPTDEMLAAGVASFRSMSLLSIMIPGRPVFAHRSPINRTGLCVGVSSVETCSECWDLPVLTTTPYALGRAA